MCSLISFPPRFLSHAVLALKWRISLAAGLMAMLVACGGNADSSSCVASSTVTCIGASGGTISSTGGATVSVPANALTSTIGISARQDAVGSPSLPAGTSAAGLVWQLLPHGAVFVQPVTITLPFDPTALAPGALPRLYKAQPNGNYVEITPVTVNGSTLSAKVTSFSYFAITANKAPVALLTLPAGNALTGQEQTFSASGSSDAEGAIANYTWNFGDGSAVQQGPGLVTVTHQYSTAGSYAVSLTVTDSQGLTSVAAATLFLTNPLPVCVLPQVLTGGVCVTPLPVCVLPQVLEGNVCVTPYVEPPPAPLPLTCTLPQVLSGGVCVTPPPVNQSPTASVATNNTGPVTGQEVLLNPGASADADGSIVSYQWNFGDGTTATGTTAAVQYKSWSTPGSKTVTLTVTDNQGASNAYALVITVAAYLPIGTLNDTGIDWCTEKITTPSIWVNNAVCSAVAWGVDQWGTVQDAFYGRDAQARMGTLTKVGAGMAGFDYTKLGADGKPLVTQNGTWSDAGTEAAGTRWDCVRDNTTGLIWEVKRNDATHLRHMGHIYAWYNPDMTSNGGTVGYPNSGNTGAHCTGVADIAKCNTQSYVTAVNVLPEGQALCGFRDWRMPVVDELNGLAHLGRSYPAFDTDYFPNTVFTASVWYWSSSPGSADNAWFVDFSLGVDYYGNKYNAFPVRLVRFGQ